MCGACSGISRRSIPQHPEDGTRLFSSNLASLYAHRFTTVFRATRMPMDYPAAFNLPTEANSAAYTDRGWCFAQSCWATLTKDFRLLAGPRNAGRRCVDSTLSAREISVDGVRLTLCVGN
eukprot:6875407-Prymnesium_polylepis.2